MKKKYTNEVLEDHSDWLLVDISTPKHPGAKMAVDTDAFLAHEGGRIFAVHLGRDTKYIYALYNRHKKNHYFHRDVIDLGKKQCDHITHGTMSFAVEH